MSSCSELKLAYDNLQTLTDELKLKLQELKAGQGNLEEAREIQIRVETADWEYEKRLRMMEEKIALDKFFGFAVEVPTLPKEMTPEKLKAWEKLGLELHYLPPMTLDEKADYPGWKKRPELRFEVNFDLPQDILELPGGWLLVEAIERPEYNDDNQLHENDPLAKTMEEQRKQGRIQAFKHPASRFNLSPQELDDPEVRKTVAIALGIEFKKLSLLKYIEFNVLGNIHYPEWGNVNTCEWFKDKIYSPRLHAHGGGFFGGGLSSVSWSFYNSRGGNVGFRVLGRF